MRPAWLASASAILSYELTEANLLSIDETLKIREAFFGRIRDAHDATRANLAVHDLPDLWARLDRRVTDLAEETLVAFTSVDRDIGALVLPARPALSAPATLWKVSAEDLALSTAEAADGLCVERNYFDRSGQSARDGIIEVTSWGILRISLVTYP